MPIWRFKTGDFVSPLEKSGLVPVVHYATPEGTFTRFDLRKRLSRWRVVEVEPYTIAGWLNATRRASSTPRALRELESLNRHLRADPTRCGATTTRWPW